MIPWKRPNNRDQANSQDFETRRNGKHGAVNSKTASVIKSDSGKWKTESRMRERLVDTDRIVTNSIDSGIAEHFINDHQLFTKTRKVTPVTLHLSDRLVINAEYKGEIKVYLFAKNILLTTIYNIPTLQLNVM